MRLVITGGEGQLGRALSAAMAASETPFDVTGLGRADGDITDRPALAARFNALRPDVVVNCAAWTDVDGCARDPGRAYRVNALGAGNVAAVCREIGARLVHISSNEVFAGDRPGGYDEAAPPGPINAYGRSKCAAEQLVRQLIPAHAIVRTAWLYAPGGRNFIHAIMRRAQQSGEVRVVADEVGNPTYVPDLAAALVPLIVGAHNGTFHLTNAGACSRWAFAAEILRLAGMTDVGNIPILGRDFRRDSSPPRFAALHNRAAAAVGITLRPWPEALAAYVADGV